MAIQLWVGPRLSVADATLSNGRAVTAWLGWASRLKCVAATSGHERKPAVPNHDPELEIVRLAVQNETDRSLKRTILTCLLIMAARRRRVKAAVASGLAGGLALAHWWHPLWLLLSRIIHLSAYGRQLLVTRLSSQAVGKAKMTPLGAIRARY